LINIVIGHMHLIVFKNSVDFGFDLVGDLD